MRPIQTIERPYIVKADKFSRGYMVLHRLAYAGKIKWTVECTSSSLPSAQRICRLLNDEMEADRAEFRKALESF